jgi:hypothetical protein
MAGERPTAVAAVAGDLVADFLRRSWRDTLHVSEDAELRATAATYTEVDWRMLAEVARREGMAPLVFQHLASAGLLGAPPPTVVSDLKRDYAVSLVGNRVLWRELRALMQAFAALGCDAVPLKGVSLAIRAYSTPALRPAGDTDLLVPPSAVMRCAEALASLGYAPRAGSERLTGSHAMRFQELVFTRARKPLVELHTTLTRAASYRRSLPLSEVWSRTQHFTVDGITLRRLHPYDEVLYLCLHLAAQHNFDRLIWLVDITQLLSRLPNTWDWDEFARQVVARGAATPVTLTFEQAQARLGAAIPADILRSLRLATQSGHERSAWRLARAPFSDPRQAGLHLLSLATFSQRIAFAREMASTVLRRLQGAAHVISRRSASVN